MQFFFQKSQYSLREEFRNSGIQKTSRGKEVVKLFCNTILNLDGSSSKKIKNILPFFLKYFLLFLFTSFSLEVN